MNNVRTAVARRDEAAAQAPARMSLAETAKAAIERQTSMLDAILPSHVDRRRFAAMTLQALKDTPKLLECFATQEGGESFILAVSQAAIVGLEPNTPTEECWILPRNVKDRQTQQWRQEAELSIGYRGLLKLARRTGNVRYAGAEVVYENDEFDWHRGLAGDHLHHRPATGDRGPLAFAYALVRFHAGDPVFEVLSAAQVHDRRASSESWKRDQKNSTTYSPWSQPHKVDRMWRKSAVRAVFPYLDYSVEVQALLDRDERALTFDPVAGAIDVAPEPPDVGDLPALEAGDIPAASMPDDGPVAPPATGPQLTAVNTLLGVKHGLSGDDRFPWLTDWADRPITSTKDLSFDEAHLLIDQLGAKPDVTEEPS